MKYMNENFNNQMPNVNPQPVAPVAPMEPQAPAAPVAPVAPMAPVQPVAPAAPMAPQAPMAPAAPVAPAVPKQPMDKNAIMKWIGFGCGIAMAVSTLLPWVSVWGISANLFDGSALFAIIMILLGAIASVTYFFGKAKRFALIGGGGAFVLTLQMVIEGSEGAAIGFWLMFLSGLALIVLSIIENLDEIKSMFGTKSTVPAAVAPVAPIAPVAPTVQAAVLCANCGQPKKNPADQFCQSCGQRY